MDDATIHTLIREVPAGAVASYGMIASLLPGVGPRQVARAMRSGPADLAWHRILTASGAPADHAGAARQRQLLQDEGVAFRRNGAVDWRQCRWAGPSQGWVDASGRDIEEIMEIIGGWRR